MPVFDLAEQPLRALNAALHASGGDNGRFEVLNPRGAHSVAVGVEHPCEIEVMGPVGYYCGGMNEAGYNLYNLTGKVRHLRI